MSHHHQHHYRPHGPPHHHHPQPPPYNTYPPHLQPPPATYAYIPTPVVMPVPAVPAYPVTAYPAMPEQPQPTYVTNYVYNQPEQPSPVHVVESPAPEKNEDQVSWIPATTSNASQLAHKAVVAGKEPGWNSSPLWVIRAHHSGNLVPGKLAVYDRRAYIPIAGKEVPVHNFEVLSAPADSVRWVASRNGQVPVGAIPGGNTHTGETLYIGRVKYSGSTTPGKVHPSHGCIYISFGGTEVPQKSYEVLCRVV